MNKIKKILAPTDLSKLSAVGVRYALDLAKESGAEVIVYHVVSTDEITHSRTGSDDTTVADYSSRSPQLLLDRHKQALTTFLDESCADLLSQVTVHSKADFGRPAKNIIDESKRDAVDLIVISTHGRTGLSHILLGSVTEKVVREATCPVLSIRPEGLKQEKATAPA